MDLVGWGCSRFDCHTCRRKLKLTAKVKTPDVLQEKPPNRGLFL